MASLQDFHSFVCDRGRTGNTYQIFLMLDLEDINESVTLSEFTLDDFRIELSEYIEATGSCWKMHRWVYML